MIITKTKFQKDKEEREAKLKKAADDAAAVLAASISELSDSGAQKAGSGSWVRGGVVQHGGGDGSVAQAAVGTVYTQQARLPAAPSAIGSNVAGFDDGDDEAAASTAAAEAVAGRKRKEMDSLLQELKRKQEQPSGPTERPLPPLRVVPSAADADLTTTNIYVGNLAPTVTEESLLERFKRFGPIISVKVMWPRTEEERARGRNKGFVLFENRKDAENSIRALQDAVIDGCGLRLGWAKGVKQGGPGAASALVLDAPKLATAASASASASGWGPNGVSPAAGAASGPSMIGLFGAGGDINKEMLQKLIDQQLGFGAGSISGGNSGVAAAAAEGGPMVSTAMLMSSNNNNDINGASDGGGGRPPQPPQPPSAMPMMPMMSGPPIPPSLPAPPSYQHHAAAASGSASKRPRVDSFGRELDEGDRAASTSGTSPARPPPLPPGASGTSNGNSSISGHPHVPPSFGAGAQQDLQHQQQQHKEEARPMTEKDRLLARYSREKRVDGRRIKYRSGWDMDETDASTLRRLCPPAWLPQELEMPSDALTREVMLPSDEQVRRLIDTWSEYVKRDGQGLEAMLMARVQGTDGGILPNGLEPQQFSWLFESTSAEAVYYRWRVYSLLQGDSFSSWRTKPFQMCEGGSWWIPPPCTIETTAAASQLSDRGLAAGGGAAAGSSMAVDEREAALINEAEREERRREDVRRERESRKLPSEAAECLIDLLNNLTLRRPRIFGGMMFAMDHSEYGHHVASIIADSMGVGQYAGAGGGAGIDGSAASAVQSQPPPAPVQVARLYLISDILSNASTASIRGASQYRSHFQTLLPDIFECVGRSYRSIGGRITREAMRDRVTKVLAVWERQSIFPPLFLSGLESTFLRRGDISVSAADIGAESGAAAADGGAMDGDGSAQHQQPHHVYPPELIEVAVSLGLGPSVDDISVDDLRKRCRAAGVSTSAPPMHAASAAATSQTRAAVIAMLKRLAWLREYTRATVGQHLGGHTGGGGGGASTHLHSLQALQGQQDPALLALFGGGGRPQPSPASAAAVAAPATSSTSSRQQPATTAAAAPASSPSVAKAEPAWQEIDLNAAAAVPAQQPQAAAAPLVQYDDDDDIDGIDMGSASTAVTTKPAAAAGAMEVDMEFEDRAAATAAAGAGADDDDLDGVPLPLLPPSAAAVATVAEAYDDDLDGVPLS